MLYLNNEPLNFLQFSAGETHIKLENPGKNPVVTMMFESNKDLIDLALVKDALNRMGSADVTLVSHYFPYSRQDRVMTHGESLGVKVVADTINRMGFSQVVTLDDHSSVVDAVLDRHYEIPRSLIIDSFPEINNLLKESLDPVIVSPDAGAYKSNAKIVESLSKRITALRHVSCEKIRDVSNGAITHFSLNGDVSGADCLILDDICDGGFTFIKTAEALREAGAASVSLYVTHGIFSKGLECLKEAGISNIFTTTSFKQGEGVFLWDDA